jgi:large conductance mechanosensitive channel
MKTFLEEFRAFAIRGNVFDLAIGVIIGTAFGKIVASLVDTVIMPIFGLVLGGVDFTGWILKFGDVAIAYGKFIQAVVDFTIIAFIIFIFMRFLNNLKKNEVVVEAEKVPTEEVLLLREIRDAVNR